MVERIEEPPAKTGDQDAPSWQEMLKRLRERDEEILRLRDLLIGRDAELGAMRGRLAVLEQHSQRLAGLAARIPIPGLGRLVAAVLRRLRG